jgi:RNA polymerase sigma factor (sigma-70 family)
VTRGAADSGSPHEPRREDGAGEGLDLATAVDLVARVERIARETGDERLAATLARCQARQSSQAHLHTSLMDNFRSQRNLEAYSLLYELNYREFLLAIHKRLRFVGVPLDAEDILEDVFVSIYRYPHKFRDEKEFSFRNWSYSIIRNTILKHLRGATTGIVMQPSETLLDLVEDTSERGPLARLEAEEDRGECGLNWLLILGNYLSAFSRLSDREQRALQLVEVEGVRYREASDRLGIKLENLKMVICRARKKIFRVIGEVAGGDP